MSVTYTLRQGDLDINGQKIVLPGKATQLIELDDFLVVLVYYLDSLTRNVFCFDASGNKLWTIEKSAFAGPSDPYVRLWTEDQQLIAETWQGISHKVDLQNGKVEVCGFSK